MYYPISKTISSLRYALLFSGALFMSGAVYAQTQNLGVGTAVKADGTDTNGNVVKILGVHPGTHQVIDEDSTLNPTKYWKYDGPAGEEAIGNKNVITDVIGKGYADMNRQTRNAEEADGTYAQPGFAGGKHQGVIDYGVTRDSKWTTVVANADEEIKPHAGTSNPYGPPPAISGESAANPQKSNPNWGSEARQQGVANFLKDYSSATGYIDNWVYDSKYGTGVRASSAELYGNAEFNKEGGMFDAVRGQGYDAGTGYREGGLMFMDKKGAGVIGQMSGINSDEGGQYVMDAQGNIRQAVPTAPSKNPDFNHATAPIPYDDWNQYGIVTTGMDLIAYTTSFSLSPGDEFKNIGGTFSVLGNFLDVYINGNKVDRSLMTLTEKLLGTTYGDGRGILGEYDFFLDLVGLDDSFFKTDGINDISFMVETVTPWDLGLTANTTYGGEAGFNYFSAPDLVYGYDPNGSNPGNGAATPEPATLAIMGLGLAGLGLARSRRNRKAA